MPHGIVAALILTALAGADGASDTSTDAPLRWYVVPNFVYDTDDGFGTGVRGELALDAPGYTPYQTAYVVHLFATIRGFHHHRFRFDRTGLGENGNGRFTAHLAWRQWLNDGYWGIGNTTTRERAYVGSFDGDDPARKRYRYSLFQPFAHFTLRWKIAPTWALFSSLDLKYSIVRTYAGSLLAEERPYGSDGGFAAVAGAGLVYDSRSPEITPDHGIMAELSGRYAPPLPDGAGGFGGVFASVRAYQKVASFLVLAGRVMGERLWGAVPFFEMVHWGGLQPVTGFGGAEAVRGIAFGRWRAPGKAIANFEARFDIVTHLLGNSPLRWQLVPAASGGLVFSAPDDQPLTKQRHPLHGGAGLGIRAIYEEAFVGRVDTAVGFDPIREPDGRVADHPTFGFYIVFDHTF